MTESRLPETLSGCRAEARRLLDHLRGGDPQRARAAATRFVRLRSFATIDVDDLLTVRARVRLKHALAVVAEEHGTASWSELARELETRATSGAGSPVFHSPRLDSLLNRWFRTHAEARASLQQQGGFLLPFRQHCFITESEGILALGLDPHDPDWVAVAFDLVRPRDAGAHARLCAKRRAALAAELAAQSEPRRAS